MKKRIAILGSTGSIGQQALEVINAHPGAFEVEVLTANKEWKKLVEQARANLPNVVVIGDDAFYTDVMEALTDLDIKVYAGEDAIRQVVEMDTIDMVLNALVGYAGFEPTLKSLEAGKAVALANKESLVVGGALVVKTLQSSSGIMIPVDSEHSAIFQCLAGEQMKSVEKIILTASGGPFLNTAAGELAKVSVREALKHPNWVMGAKITIDSASLMNKGLEVIEAHWLFGLPANKIDVVVHPQSIIHSMVQFVDGSMKAQMGLPDMRQPILYAFSYPNRMFYDAPRFNFVDFPQLTFKAPDIEKFRNLALAFEALEKGGNAACILNAANEVAVDAFLNGRIGFLEMPGIIEQCLLDVDHVRDPSLQDYRDSDRAARAWAESRIKQ